MSDFGRLRSYDRFLIPVHALVWTASDSWRGHELGYRQCSSRYLDTWEECGEDGVGLYSYEQRAVHNPAAACVAAGSGIFENQL